MDANFPLTPGRNSSEEKAHLSTNYSHQTMDGNISSPTSPGQKSSEDKPRLSEKQKKANHIASEQKRRQAIREGFDRLTELVPGLEGQGRSESVVLKKTVDFMRDQVEERKRLIARIEELGGEVDDSKRI